MKEEVKTISVGIPGRDQLHCHLTFQSAGAAAQRVLVAASVTAVGCLPFLRYAQALRESLQTVVSGKQDLFDLTEPVGSEHTQILVREFISKVQDRWVYPYSDTEICHCRAVPTSVVDAAIVGGAHSLDQIRRQTSACTSCGTCRPDIEKIFELRLKTK